MAKAKKSSLSFDSVIKWLSILSNIGLWGFVIFLLDVHWAHHLPLFNSDFDITLYEPNYNQYYIINGSFKNTFIISNTWTEPIDGRIKITNNDCVTIKYYCPYEINNNCPKSPSLTNESIFRGFSGTKYITVEGKFVDCTDVVKICLWVDEPIYPKNDKHKCMKFNPSQLKI